MEDNDPLGSPIWVEPERVLHEVTWTVSTLDELTSYIKDNFVELYNNSAAVKRNGGFERKITDEFEFKNLSVRVIRLWLKEEMRNSHSCPVGGVRNWQSDPKVGPSSYPGLTGKIVISYDSNHYLYGVGTMLTDMMINTGSGGGGGCNGNSRQGKTSYEFSLWESDWPKLMETMRAEQADHIAKEELRVYEHELDAVQRKLKGDYIPTHRKIDYFPFKDSVNA